MRKVILVVGIHHRKYVLFSAQLEKFVVIFSIYFSPVCLTENRVGGGFGGDNGSLLHSNMSIQEWCISPYPGKIVKRQNKLIEIRQSKAGTRGLLATAGKRGGGVGMQ